jgi:diaminohydroxyphosphoribosylaminopyrimidine deaminase/5-amino-6-(5-phosphoribosylamino)uracil reductase
MLDDLGNRQVNELHLEAGHKLNGSFIREGLVDELLVYLAAKMLGGGRGMAAFGPVGALAGALPLRITTLDRVGPDIRITARSLPTASRIPRLQ